MKKFSECEHAGEKYLFLEHIRCSDCHGIRPTDYPGINKPDWGAATNRWFPPVAVAEQYRMDHSNEIIIFCQKLENKINDPSWRI